MFTVVVPFRVKVPVALTESLAPGLAVEEPGAPKLKPRTELLSSVRLPVILRVAYEVPDAIWGDNWPEAVPLTVTLPMIVPLPPRIPPLLTATGPLPVADPDVLVTRKVPVTVVPPE